ncbi:heavy metal-responsive transcriptional regulator [Emticicia aquatilis]|uniref:Heavy metal-responsive transcriptional regulator n=1 Tax=Emticicia aquatilis TaxID=1537369 RepID=A0A916YJI6_9BACT|nr:MerR family transcriptional regulator [Emticicia aquatilis]GGD48014.1 heavy metal-responsive transcriptional regulator [Emticicia aquatilis]
MLIGELSNKTGLSRDTIRFYEKQGLISIGRKERRENNYKEYSENTLHKLLTIKRIKNFGFTLNETEEFLALLDRDAATCENVAEKMNEKLFKIDEKIKELQDLRSSLSSNLTICLSNCCQSESNNCQMLSVN